ncbi:putative (+)-neomenthol dehydrogenase [Helianthus anomalus]
MSERDHSPKIGVPSEFELVPIYLIHSGDPFFCPCVHYMFIFTLHREESVFIAMNPLQVVDEKAHLLSNIIEEPYELGEKCLKTNYYATKKVTESFIPLLKLSKSPRVVNVTSGYGHLYWFHNEKFIEELQDIDNLTEERIDETIQWFLSDFKAGKLKENGWPLTVSAYKVSKAALNAYTRLMARKHEKILVNCVHPGYVITDMTSQTGALTAEEGAKGPVMVALLPDNGPSGVYFHQTKIAPFSIPEFASFVKAFYEGK